MEFDFEMRRHGAERPRDNTPFSLLILGDFSGDGAAADAASAAIRKVDIDNFNELWDSFEPSVELDVHGKQFTFEPRDLDDFHPDQLFHRLAVFQELRRLRKRLTDPATADAALAELLASGTIGQPGPETQAESGVQSAAPPAESGDDMFARLLGERPDTGKAGAAATQSQVDRLIQSAVAPYVVAAPDPHVDAAIDSVDRGIADVMRAVLHHPRFQAQEAAWRSLSELVHRTETDETLEIRVCSIGKGALLQALPPSAAGFEDSNIWRLLVERFRLAADDRTPSLIAADYYFGTGPDDVALLAALGSIATATDSAVLGAALPETIGCEDLIRDSNHRAWGEAPGKESLWGSLRQAPFAGRIGLALPRLLARLPYGRDTDPVSAFDFEELSGRDHAAFLWANPTLALAGLLADCFVSEGWSMQPGGALDIGELPAYSYTEDGESKMLPCAEILMPEASAEQILNRGIMPIVSFRNQDRARLLRFESIADPLAPLRGPWED